MNRLELLELLQLICHSGWEGRGGSVHGIDGGSL